MTALQKAIGATVITALSVTGLFQAHRLSSLQNQVQLSKQREAGLSAEIDRVRSERDGALSRAAAVESEKEQLGRAAAEIARLRAEVARLHLAERERAQAHAQVAEPELRFWSAQVKSFKDRLEQMPNRNIPELQLLTEWDWLEVTKAANLETEAGVRRAFSSLRKRAKQQFAQLLREAFRKYAEAHEDRTPAALDDLKPFLDRPVGEDILRRYQYTPKGPFSQLSGQDGLVNEKAPPVDFFDSRISIAKDAVMIDEVNLPNDALLRVFDEFFAGNYTQEPENLAALEPYARTAEEREALKKLIESEPRSGQR